MHGTKSIVERIVGWMKLSCIWAVGLILAGTGGAAALDAPHALHPAKSADRHVVEPRHAAGHSAAAHVAKPAHKSAPAHAATTRTATSHAAAKAVPDPQKAILTTRGKARASVRRAALTSRRHRYH